MLKQLMAGPPRLSLAVAESVTGGRLQMLITRESGASTFFLGGITAYNLEQKVRHLGVERLTAERVDCVSAEVAWQMARGACVFFGADIALATTGYAEAMTGKIEPAPGVFWALCHRRTDGTEAKREGFLEFPGMAREAVQAGAAETVYARLEAYLRELRPAVD